jgi:DNA polymerase III subunit gamma/tau
MSWDTKYRPRTYNDVLGQQATISILRQIVKSGRGYHQSYLFTGPFGTGKTTVGRILARALLCSDPQDGDPCDQCRSCKEMLRTGRSESFTEIDAATNSGKEGIRRILETIEFGTFSGKRRIYLFDESHQLSRDALDALLKPLEDTRGDSGERRLVCIFCTTEPEKMRETIGSRCGPTFAIHTVPPEKTAERLAWICEQEQSAYESDALQRVSESVEGHIRDALKACEMLSVQGGITLENVERFLGHDLNVVYLDLLEHLRDNAQDSLDALKRLLVRVSPAVIYEKLARICLLSYKLGLGIGKAPSFWDDSRLQSIGASYRDTLLDLAELFSSRPRRPTGDMLLCDLLSVHRRSQGGISLGYADLSPLEPAGRVVLSQHATESRVQSPAVVEERVPAPVPIPAPEKASPLPSTTDTGNNHRNSLGTYVPPWGMSGSRLEAMRRLGSGGAETPETEEKPRDSEVDFSRMTPQSFSLLVLLRAQELATGTPSGLKEAGFCSLVAACSRELSETVNQGGEADRQIEEADSETLLRSSGEGAGSTDGLQV